MEGAYRGVERRQRTRSSINSRSVFRPPSFLRNLETYCGRVVRELLSQYNNDPLQGRNEFAETAAGDQYGEFIANVIIMSGPLTYLNAETSRRGVIPQEES